MKKRNTIILILIGLIILALILPHLGLFVISVPSNYFKIAEISGYYYGGGDSERIKPSEFGFVGDNYWYWVQKRCLIHLNPKPDFKQKCEAGEYDVGGSVKDEDSFFGNDNSKSFTSNTNECCDLTIRIYKKEEIGECPYGSCSQDQEYDTKCIGDDVFQCNYNEEVGDYCWRLKYECSAQGETCSDGECVPSCIPKTCSELGKECGTWSDGCGGILDCGSCQSGYTCQNGICVISNGNGDGDGGNGDGDYYKNSLTMSEFLSADFFEITKSLCVDSCNPREGYTVKCDKKLADKIMPDVFKESCTEMVSTIILNLPNTWLAKKISQTICSVPTQVYSIIKSSVSLGVCYAEPESTISKYWNSFLRQTYELGVPRKWVMPVVIILIILLFALIIGMIK